MSYEYFTKIPKNKCLKVETIVNTLKKDKIYNILSFSDNKILLKNKNKLKTYGDLPDIELILEKNEIIITIYNAARDERNYFVNSIEFILQSIGIIVIFEEE